MIPLPSDKSFVAVALNENGASAFTYLKDASKGSRQVYFVNEVRKGAITEAQMLLGQFIFEFEKSPVDALRLTPGATNRLYFPREGEEKGDNRVETYDSLTPEEVADTRERLAALSAIYPSAGELLEYL